METILNDTMYCRNCNIFRVQIFDGGFSCPMCGETSYGYVPNYNKWIRTRPRHSRAKWFSGFARKYVSDQYVGLLVSDFIRVVDVLVDYVSRYGYYLIRLASRRGVELADMPNDLREGTDAKYLFDYNLVYGRLPSTRLG